MATKTVTTCDMCGKDPASTVTVSAAGARGDVDLCERHARALTAAVEPFVRAGRPNARPAPARTASATKRGRKTATRKAATKNTATKNTATKKTATNKTAAKKTATKKAATKKAATKKTAAKAAAHKRSGRSAAAKKTTTGAPRRSRRGSNVAAIRNWGWENGFEVATRGRLKPDLVAAYTEATRAANTTN